MAAHRFIMLGWLVLPPLSACSVFSAAPTLELVKAAGSATSYAIAGVPARATQTVQHAHARPSTVCIAFNPAVPSPEFVPAIQSALQAEQVSSRVFDGLVMPGQCPVWLTYSATLDWGVPPWGNGYQMYVVQATLTLRTAEGTLLASSHYAPGGSFEWGKWASVPDLIEPVVKALMTRTDS
jgi:hypothetical protein